MYAIVRHKLQAFVSVCLHPLHSELAFPSSFLVKCASRKHVLLFKLCSADVTLPLVLKGTVCVYVFSVCIWHHICFLDENRLTLWLTLMIYGINPPGGSSLTHRNAHARTHARAHTHTHTHTHERTQYICYS